MAPIRLRYHQSTRYPAPEDSGCIIVVRIAIHSGRTPKEESDIMKTLELVDDLKDMRSLIVPLFFVPLGKLRSEDWFNDAQLSEAHKQLLIACAEHDFRWVDNLLDLSFSGKWYQHITKEFYKGFSAIAKRKVRQIE